MSLIALMDAETNTAIAGKYPARENSEKQVTAFFGSLKENGLNPLSCTVDGNPQVIKVLRKLWPEIVIQRCLVHVQRQGLMWCRVNPAQSYARKLRELFVKVTCIRSKEERDLFLGSLIQWEKEYGVHLKRRPERGRVFSDIKRARSMLLNALPDMFHYLDDPFIPPTTNSLEGYFSRLKGQYWQHRGLTKERLDNYFNWFLLLKPK